MSFRPLSGLCLFRLVLIVLSVVFFITFPSPVGVMSIQTWIKCLYIIIETSFRPLSGLCLFRLTGSAAEWLDERFPSPVGVMSIQTMNKITLYVGLKFPSPVGVMSIQTGMQDTVRESWICFRPLSGLCLFRLGGIAIVCLTIIVSVPCRGYVYSDSNSPAGTSCVS